MMANNQNGFAEMADYLGTLAKVDPVKLSKESLTAAADFYTEKLIPNIPKSLLKKEHASDHVVVEILDSEVRVVFEGTAFYWRFVENGTVNQKAQNFASGTYEQNKKKIEEIMVNKIIDHWKG